eukprot:1194368-Prorocentrum_minimum.AAC.14
MTRSTERQRGNRQKRVLGDEARFKTARAARKRLHAYHMPCIWFRQLLTSVSEKQHRARVRASLPIGWKPDRRSRSQHKGD